MIKSNPLSPSEQVTQHIQNLPPDIAGTVEYIRQIILSADPEIAEHIKWNNPSFYYTGEMKAFNPKEYKRDLIVMNLHRGKIMLVLPTGASINDTTGLLEGEYTDGRRLISFKDIDDVKSKEEDLKWIIREWLGMVEKE
jgi:hypothetical protein